MDMISVVIPAYNAAPWLPRCIDSLLAQTYPNLEIIVVDDGSSDNTAEVLEKYTEKHPSVRTLRKKNGGEYAARLSGVEIARGAWIGFVDSDDEVEPQMYAQLMENARETGADISHCGYKVIYGDGRVEYLQNTGLRKVQDSETALRDLLEEKIMETGLCNKMFRRELFAGLTEWMDFSIVNNGDLLMNYYLFSRCRKAIFEDVCPYHYLIREGSASRRHPNSHILYDPIRARQSILEQCPEALRDDARRAMIRLCLVSYRLVCLEDRKAYGEDEQKLRAMIRAQRDAVGILSSKNALQVRLISSAHGVYRTLYRGFAGLFRK